VIINDDREAHIKNLKELPPVEEEVDRCIECGYCEHKCPSRDITTTPRRRIVIRRVLKSLEMAGNKPDYELLLKQYQYDVLDTCAVDGLCATACPVDINTGDLVKRLRRENHSPFANKIALSVAKNFRTVERLARTALKTGITFNNLFGKNTMRSFTGAARKICSRKCHCGANNCFIPRTWVLSMINGQRKTPPSFTSLPASAEHLGVYEGKDKNLMETFLSICKKTGIGVNVLKNAEGSCCSQIFSSKGFGAAAQYSANKIIRPTLGEQPPGAIAGCDRCQLMRLYAAPYSSCA
jgi:D-lactate dehydrogenase